MRTAVLALFLAFPIFASSPEYLVGDALPAAAAGSRARASAASNGSDFFVVWTDSRSGSPAVIGTRVTRLGQILDPLGIRISDRAASMSTVQVAWDGEAYVVVWSTADVDGDILAARILPNGKMPAAPRLIVENGFLESSGRFLASNGAVSVVVHDHEGTGRITVFGRDGQTVQSEVLSTTGTVRNPSVAAGPGGFVVTWADGSVVHAVTLDATGHIRGTPKTIGPGEHPAVASNAASYTIAWYRNDRWEEWSLHSRTFDQNLDPIGADLTHVTTGRQIANVDVVTVGNHFEVFVASSLSGGVYEVSSIAVDAMGHASARITRNTLFGELWLDMLSFATNGQDVLAARAAATSVGYQIFAQLYEGNRPTPETNALLSWSGNAHRDPQIAAGPAGFLVSWVENDGAFATRIDAAGRSLDGRGIRLTGFPYSDTRAAFDGTNWVVAYRDESKIRVRYLSPADGATVAETALRGEFWSNFAIATTPEATYVAYSPAETYVTRIAHATHAEDAAAPVMVSPKDVLVDNPAISWNGSELLVVWNEIFLTRGDPPFSYSPQIWGARVTAGMTLLDPSPLHIASSDEDSGTSFGAPSVASNGRDWLMVADVNGHDIIGRRVVKEGVVVGDAPTKIGAGITPVATWNGTSYAVAWKGGEDWSPRRPLLLHTVDGYGALTVMSRVFVAQDVVADGGLSMAPVANATAAVAYVKVSLRPEHAGVQRSFFRVMDSGGPPRGRVIRR